MAPTVEPPIQAAVPLQALSANPASRQAAAPPAQVASAAAAPKVAAAAAAATPEANVASVQLELSGLVLEKLDDAPAPLRIVRRLLRGELAQLAAAEGVDRGHVHLHFAAAGAKAVQVLATLVPPQPVQLKPVESRMQAGAKSLQAAVEQGLQRSREVTAIAASFPVRCVVQEVFLDNWREAVTPDGEKYYWSEKTQITSWHNPAEAEEEDKEEAQEPSPTKAAPATPAKEDVIMDETDSMTLTFLTADHPPKERTIQFFERPIGMVWYENEMPIKVCGVRKKGFADQQGVHKKWALSKVNGESVLAETGHDYNSAYAILMAACGRLPEKGTDVKDFA